MRINKKQRKWHAYSCHIFGSFKSVQYLRTPSTLLEKYGIQGTCLNWFKSYLTNRKLRSKCKLTTGTKYSEWYDVEYSTPQGSCLGPLLFLIFCNDLYKNLSFLKSIQFADDTTLYFGHENKNFVLCCLEHDL